MSAIAQPSATGITAQAIMASAKVSIGAIRNRMRLAPLGTMVSFMNILMASAKGWNRPNGPTTLGPRRSWIAAMILRSARVIIATATSNGTSSARALATVRRVKPTGWLNRKSIIAATRLPEFVAPWRGPA